MGWIGMYKKYKTNLENVKYCVLYGETESETQWYKGLVQRGSSVYLLGQNKNDKRYWVDCILCQNVRRKGYSEFMYKGINATENMRFDFPKKWVSLLDANDPDIKKYITARNEYEQKKKSAYKPKLNDLFRCKSSRNINFGGYTINSGEEFYIKYNDWYGRKYFMLADENGNVKRMKITRNTFNNLEKELVSQ